MVMMPVSLTFLSVPVSSSALACAAQKAAAIARPIIRRRFIGLSSLRQLQFGYCNQCTNRAATAQQNVRLCSLTALHPCNDRAIAWAGTALLVGVRIRRVRRLGELVLQFRADRRVEVQPLRRDLLGKPFVIDLLALATRIERCGRSI